MTLRYETIFEIGLRSFPWASLLHPMIALVVGLPLFLFGMRKPLYRYIGAAVACFGILVMVLATITFVPEYVSLRGAYARGESSIVQGRSEERRVGKECRSRWSPYH